MEKTTKTTALFLAASLFSFSATAQLNVIFDNGEAVPLSMFIDIDNSDNDTQVSSVNLDEAVKLIPQVEFPIVTERVSVITTPGTLTNKQLERLPYNIFVIGNDKYSLQWLRLNKEELSRFNAVGIVATAKDQGEFLELQQLAHPLRLFPYGADFLVEEFELPGWPVLMTSQGIFQ